MMTQYYGTLMTLTQKWREFHLTHRMFPWVRRLALLLNTMMPANGKNSPTRRSEQDKVIVGAKSESSLSLSVDLGGTLSVPPPPQSDTISFTLSGPGGNSDVGFGKISRGTNEKRSITVQNNGTNAIYMESIITGDPVFTAYMRVDGLPWREYSSEIEAKKSKDLELGLTVPTDYNGTGVKTGQLTVWATRSN